MNLELQLLTQNGVFDSNLVNVLQKRQFASVKKIIMLFSSFDHLSTAQFTFPQLNA
jgi:hypothetical protein